MLKLEAIYPAEGTAIVRADQTLRLLRPPYLLSECPVLPEDAVGDAILHHGFFAAQEEFAGWDEAIAHLNRAALEFRQAAGSPVPDEVPTRELLELAPVEVLGRFLDRAEKELIPQGHFDHAQDFLLALLTGNATTQHAELKNRAAALLDRSIEAEKRARSGISELASRDLRFPSLEKHGQLESTARLAEQVRMRGRVLMVA